MNKIPAVSTGHLRMALVMAMVALLAGCGLAARPPLYQSPPDTTGKAFLKLQYSHASILSGVGRVYRYEGSAAGPDCDKPLPGIQTLFVQSRGNPLVSDQNMEGIWIPAGARFYMQVRTLRDTAGICLQYPSFIPKNGASYVLHVAHVPHQSDDGQYVECDVGLTESGDDKGTQKEVAPAAGFHLDACYGSEWVK